MRRILCFDLIHLTNALPGVRRYGRSDRVKYMYLGTYMYECMIYLYIS
jgi:hypothetical protein